MNCFQKCHPKQHAEYIANKDAVSKRKMVDETPSTSAKQTKLDVYKIGETKGIEEKVNKLVLRFIVSSMSPLSIVEEPGFKSLINGTF